LRRISIQKKRKWTPTKKTMEASCGLRYNKHQ
jgi:hypothetical protein